MPSLQGHVPFLLLSDLTLSASICAHLAPCLPRVRILLVESVLPGFPPPADGSGRTVHARCVQPALRASVPVRRRLRSCCCFKSFQHLPIRLSLRAGPVESVASNDRPCGIVFGSRPAAALRASSAPSDPASCARDVRHRRFGIGSWCCCCCFESFERLPIRRAGFVGARTDVGTCCGFAAAASDVRHRGIGFTSTSTT